MTRRVRENPLTQGVGLVIAGAAVVGLGTLAYVLLKPAAASATSSGSGSTTATTYTVAPGAQTVAIPAAGLYLALPSGATWASTMPINAGTSTPIFVPAGTPGQSVTEPLAWTTAAGNQTATLTLNS
jgi:hypothetical protein